MNARKKIALCGTPEFVQYFFDKILESDKYDVQFVVTQKVEQKTRGKDFNQSPIALWAAANGLEVFEVDKISDNAQSYNFHELSAKLANLDSVILFAFGKIIPDYWLGLPKQGWLNVHPSKLPISRGPSPIQYSIMHGLKNSSITLMRMNSKMDEGDIIAQLDFEIGKHETTGSLLRKICVIGPDWIIEKAYDYLIGKIKPKQQNGLATYCNLINKADYIAKPNMSVSEAISKIKAFGHLIFKAEDFNLSVDIKCFAANALPCNDNWLQIKCADGWLTPIFVQKPGKKLMHIKHFMNGYKDLK